MYNSASTNELLMSAEYSGNSSKNLLIQRRTKRKEVTLMSFASDEDDEVLFDSKQIFFFASDCLIKSHEQVALLVFNPHLPKTAIAIS